MKHLRVPRLAFIGAAALVMALSACSTPAPATGKATLRIVSPAAGATVKGPAVKVEVEAANFKLLAANPAAKEGEGHVHFFIDVPASSVKVGDAIPLDQPKVYVHAGKEPFTSRELTLTTGKHIITVVAADSLHRALAQPEPVSITVEVQ